MPIAVHLDHATDPEHIELALNLADQGIKFDSIMIDASHAEVRALQAHISGIKCLQRARRTKKILQSQSLT